MIDAILMGAASAADTAPALLTGGTNIGNLTGIGGLAAAFDGVTAQVSAACAGNFPSNSGYDNTAGKSWGASHTVTSFVLYGPSDDYILGNNSSAPIKLQGSNGGVSWDDLYTGTVPTGMSAVLTVATGITLAPYAYHRVNLSGNGTNGFRVAELQFTGT